MQTPEVQPQGNPPLSIVPTELLFPPPLNRVITNIIKITNTSSKHVAYKVKTTARKRYCVRPNTGIINPKESVEVQVLLNYTKDQPTDLKARDKFQVQSILLEPDQVQLDPKQTWASVPEDQVYKQKLKCYFSKPTSSQNLVTPTFTPTIPVGDDDEEEEFHETTSQIGKSTLTASSIPSESTSNAQRLVPSSHQKQEEDVQPKKVEFEDPMKTLRNQLTAVTAERDEFKREIQKLTDRMTSLERDKEATLRQRKPVEATGSSVNYQSPTNLLTQQQNKQQQINLALLVIVAIIFFILGRFTA